ncbi:MAG: hypothetical protein ACFFDT_14655 [Candidatus Hodarchaeota archaeon]
MEYLPDFFKWRDFIIYVVLIRDYTDERTADWLKQRLPPWIAEYRDRIINDTQNVEIPTDLTKWFPEN